MTLELLRSTLGWCALINIGIMMFWFLILTFAGDWVFRLHSRMLPVTREQFNGFHYAGLGTFKLAVFFFNVVPYFALRIVG